MAEANCSEKISARNLTIVLIEKIKADHVNHADQEQLRILEDYLRRMTHSRQMTTSKVRTEPKERVLSWSEVSAIAAHRGDGKKAA